MFLLRPVVAELVWIFMRMLFDVKQVQWFLHVILTLIFLSYARILKENIVHSNMKYVELLDESLSHFYFSLYPVLLKV